jgi:hypothetical protein
METKKSKPKTRSVNLWNRVRHCLQRNGRMRMNLITFSDEAGRVDSRTCEPSQCGHLGICKCSNHHDSIFLITNGKNSILEPSVARNGRRESRRQCSKTIDTKRPFTLRSIICASVKSFLLPVVYGTLFPQCFHIIAVNQSQRWAVLAPRWPYSTWR